MGPPFCKMTNVDQTITFNCSPFSHFVQEVNEIWYPGIAVVTFLRYQILLTFYAK